jgi:hypothetical protein
MLPLTVNRLFLGREDPTLLDLTGCPLFEGQTEEALWEDVGGRIHYFLGLLLGATDYSNGEHQDDERQNPLHL